MSPRSEDRIAILDQARREALADRAHPAREE